MQPENSHSLYNVTCYLWVTNLIWLNVLDVYKRQVSITLYQGDDRCIVVWFCEIYHLLTFGGDGLTCDHAVNLSRLNSRYQGIPVKLYDLQIVAQLVADFLCHHNIVAICVIRASGNRNCSVGIIGLCPVCLLYTSRCV